MSSDIISPVFLIGSERSGTTLLRLLLDSHPSIGMNLESEYMVTKISDCGKYPDINEYREWIAQDRVFLCSNFNIDTELNYKDLMFSFLEQKLTRDKKSIVGATVHYQFTKLLYLWPNAKFIYLIRDGRDVAASVVKMGWAGTPYVGIDHWISAENELQTLKSKIDSDKLIEIKYEALTENPQDELKRICRFLKVEFSNRMFDYTDTTTYAFPDPTFNYQWKKSYTKMQNQLVETKAGKLLLQRGYTLSGYEHININRVIDRSYYLHSRFFRYFQRVKKYGFLNILSETVTRRLNMEKLNKKITAKIDHITNTRIIK